jgi:hypothetical protein
LPQVRSDLLEAWERSRAAGISPDRTTVPQVLDGALLREYAGPQAVYRTGQPVLDTGAALLAGTGYGLILADGAGVVLHMAGDRELTVAAERIGSLPGSSWREQLAGNNAIGTALALGAPAQFAYHEHFCAGWVDWTCAAAPVRAPDTGELLGAVCVCGHRRPLEPGVPLMAHRLADTVARQIALLADSRHARLRAEAGRLKRWFPDRAVIAVGGDGGIAGVQGRVPQALLRELRRRPPALLPAKLRGEREVMVAGQYRCLAVPVWDDLDWLGHLLILDTAEQEPAPGPQAGPPARVVAGTHDRRLLLSLNQICAARVDGGRVLLVTETGELPTPYESLGELQKRLPEGAFFQVDRGCLVNLAKVREVHPLFNRTVQLVLADRQATKIPVSRRRTGLLRELLQF